MITIGETIADPLLFQPWFAGASWDAWRAILKAAFALPLSPQERERFHPLAERTPPRRPVRELWIIAGRRGGKDSIASVIVAHAAALFDKQHALRPGERALAMCLATDRTQAGIVLNYTRAFFSDNDMLRALVRRETRDGLELNNGVDIVVVTNDFRRVRGRAVLVAVLDEVSFWRDETCASPDEEVYRALRPGMATLPGAMMIGISTPYRRAGLLFRKWKAHYGRDDDDVLVIRAPSLALNPTLDEAVISAALAEDPAAARSEWLGEWRDDIGSFIDPAAVEAVVVVGRRELPPVPGVVYHAFTDPAGGSGTDSMALAVAHQNRQTKRVVLDALREVKPPFSPQQTVREFSALLQTYGIKRVVGDHFAGEWPREAFRLCGVEYQTSDKTKGELYIDGLADLNSARMELLDHPRLTAQLVGLERRTARSGRDSVDHAPGAHDDIVNAAIGAMHVARNKRPPMKISDALLERVARSGSRSCVRSGWTLGPEI